MLDSPGGTDPTRVDRPLERLTVEEIPLCTQLLPICHAGSRSNAVCRGEYKRIDREISQRLQSKVDAPRCPSRIQSCIFPVPIEAGVHVEAITYQTKAVGHLDLNDGGQLR